MMLPLHGMGNREDLPLPFWMVVLGAGVVLVVTFAVIHRAWLTPRWAEPTGRPLPRLTRLLDSGPWRWAVRLMAAGVTLMALVALLFGPDVVTNPAPGFIYVWLWVGLVPGSLLFGRIIRSTSPARTLLAWRPAGAGSRWGLIPGAIGLSGFAWLELVQPDRATTAVLRWWFLAWLVWSVGGALVAGTRWLASAEPFEVYSSTIATMSPWQRHDGLWHWVNPLRHLSSIQPPTGLAAVTVVLFASTVFDSFSSGTWWVRLVQNSAAPRWMWGTAGLLVTVAVIAVSYHASARRLAPSLGTRRSGDHFAPSLVPIVAGYAIAHYYSLLILEGQRTAINFSDPLGTSANWFGTAELGVNTSIINHPTAMAWIQVIAILVGHLLGVLVIHDRALALADSDQTVGDPSDVGRRQLPMLLTMVVFTCGGLVLLFAV